MPPPPHHKVISFFSFFFLNKHLYFSLLLKSCLLRISGKQRKDGGEKAPTKYNIEMNSGLKLNIQKTKITASGPITSWEIDGETVETVSDFILGAPKSLQMVTAALKLKDAYSLEGKL